MASNWIHKYIKMLHHMDLIKQICNKHFLRVLNYPIIVCMIYNQIPNVCCTTQSDSSLCVILYNNIKLVPDPDSK